MGENVENEVQAPPEIDEPKAASLSKSWWGVAKRRPPLTCCTRVCCCNAVMCSLPSPSIERPSAKIPRSLMQTWRGDWESIKTQVGGGNVQAGHLARLHGELSERTFSLMDQIADASGLSLDPVSESYYLMTVLVDHLPRLSGEVQVQGQPVERMRAAALARSTRAASRS